MIRLTNAGTGAGADGTPLDLDETQIASVSMDPGIHRTIVTTAYGLWYAVRESVEQVEQLIAEAKENAHG